MNTDNIKLGNVVQYQEKGNQFSHDVFEVKEMTPQLVKVIVWNDDEMDSTELTIPATIFNQTTVRVIYDNFEQMETDLLSL